MLPVNESWARIGPTNKSWMIHIPKAGLCLSAFLVITGPENGILIGLPKKHRAWPEQGGLPLMHAEELEKEGKYLLPATHQGQTSLLRPSSMLLRQSYQNTIFRTCYNKECRKTETCFGYMYHP